MLFCLLSMPCMATVVTVRREAGPWKWAALQTVGLTLPAHIVTVGIFQAGSALGIGT